MNKPGPFTFDTMPTFCVVVPDDSLLDIGLRTGDMLFCDGETAPARHVIATYPDDPDGVFHVCTLIGGKHLWDKAGGKDAPASATVWGRVLYVQRSLAPLEYTGEATV